MPRPKTGGRTKGTPNALGGAAKENIASVFVSMGGTAEMAEWAKANKTEFYKIYARLLPLQHTGEDGGPIAVLEVPWLQRRER